jgi:hypothetical protein
MTSILASLLVLAVAGGVLYLKVLVWRRRFGDGRDTKVEGQALEDALRGRHRRPAGMPQIAGSKCSCCRRRIIAEKEAVHCFQCADIIHRACAEKHVCANAHVPAAAHPYRETTI